MKWKCESNSPRLLSWSRYTSLSHSLGYSIYMWDENIRSFNFPSSSHIRDVKKERNLIFFFLNERKSHSTRSGKTTPHHTRFKLGESRWIRHSWFSLSLTFADASSLAAKQSSAVLNENFRVANVKKICLALCRVWFYFLGFHSIFTLHYTLEHNAAQSELNLL